MALALISVVYQNYTVLKDFIQSLENQTNKDFKLFIADHSTNRQKISSDKIDIEVINSANLGYAHGINVCMNQAVNQSYHLFCVINDDTFFKQDFTENIYSTFKKHPRTVMGGKIYYAPGYEFHKKRYKEHDLGKVIWYAGGHIDWDHVLAKHRGVDEVDTGQYEKFVDTDFITGCLMCYDRYVYDMAGPWDENYFLYYEDADFGERAKKKHIPLYYDPSLVIWHKNAQSTDGSGSKLHLSYQEKNRLKFGLKFAPFKTKYHLLKNYGFSRYIQDLLK